MEYNRSLNLVFRQLVNSIDNRQLFLEAYQDRPTPQLNSSSIMPYTKQDKDENNRGLFRSNYRSHKSKKLPFCSGKLNDFPKSVSKRLFVNVIL